ncbi:type II toxin-antitoxin system Phd/YefM family antitoxin [Rhodobacteraceae bacterium CCMM004]|nr:type II toxin-antitoxin system Phd/YefM family antitoxin [Rhodobacteraceae bacterium CCMM004]
MAVPTAPPPTISARTSVFIGPSVLRCRDLAQISRAGQRRRDGLWRESDRTVGERRFHRFERGSGGRFSGSYAAHWRCPMSDPGPIRLTVSEARSNLAWLVLQVQDPRSYAVLTRHGKPVAAMVSMAELRRIWGEQDGDEGVPGVLWRWCRTRWRSLRPGGFIVGRSGKLVSMSEAAYEVREIQRARKAERAVLKAAGVEGVKGGER